jgi:uncharacterized membrane protein YbhN (UPF0104 family)
LSAERLFGLNGIEDFVVQSHLSITRSIQGESMSDAHETIDDADWEQLRSAWSLYASAVEVWMQAASSTGAPMPANVDVDQLIHAVIAAHNSWSDAFTRVIEATHHH